MIIRRSWFPRYCDQCGRVIWLTLAARRIYRPSLGSPGPVLHDWNCLPCEIQKVSRG